MSGIIIITKGDTNEEGYKMKQYGANFATEFTKKQIGVVYGKAKSGILKVEKWYMSNMYDLADYYGYDSNRSVAESERHIKKILEAVFSNDLENAQNLINEDSDRVYRLFSKKNQAACDRALYV